MRRHAPLSLLAGTDVAGVVGCLGGGSAPAEAGDAAKTTNDVTDPASATASSGSGSGNLPPVVDIVDAQGSSTGEV